ncbi:Transposon Tf2-6 polyprotein [Chionoecetes opilio]|uniref:RNA-directed DNA polymerase n=1 Tax=Chionoecetes opilio TaxID=41210 RepID=A0A8J5CTE8_CHIOP|nr:Transposon Tf2-6 polyprotein [Chionoecetes opilio]
MLPGQVKPRIRVSGDYSVTVNQQLEPHRHPMTRPEDLMHKLGGGYGFTKIDLADAYNQIKLGPDSQRKLALSTHRGVLLQMRLLFGITSAPGYFQEIMEQLTSDLPGVAVYLDDILVSGSNAAEHLRNLRGLLHRLDANGLRCRREKCSFAEPQIEYLGHVLSTGGVAKGTKVDDVIKMPAPTDATSLRSFLGSVQFYGKFLPDLATVTEPLHRLTRKDSTWKWGAEEQDSFQSLKELLSTDTVLVHFDQSTPIGISCDASNVGIGAVLFHRYSDGSERPIANVSKTLSKCQRNYSQIQKEALAIVFALKKFHQYLYGRHFVLVTDHKPLLALFGPTKATPALAVNRLARWALQLSQHDYSIEYRKTAHHGNANALSRLPTGTDSCFDGEESDNDVDTICAINMINTQIKLANATTLQKESAKDKVVSTIMRHSREGWPPERREDKDSNVENFRGLADSLSTSNGCLLYGSRVVIPASLCDHVLQLLHLGHLGMQRMKQLARTAVYWPNIDRDIEKTSRNCSSCAQHQNKPAKPAIHPWMLPEKPWSRLHLDHAISFMGYNWLVVTDAYSKYPCIHSTQSISSKATIDLLEQDFAHFGYPHTLVTDNASSFLSEEFQTWCKERSITHLTGAPYHPATNGAAERLIQTFKQALRKSSLPPKAALQEFLMQYRRTPTSSGFSPSELLNNRQMRMRIDSLLPSPAHVAQGKQVKEAARHSRDGAAHVARVASLYEVGGPCYTLYCGPRRDKEPRWVPAIVVKRFGSRSFNVKVLPKGPVWRRHLEQLRPRYTSEVDSEPGEWLEESPIITDHPMELKAALEARAELGVSQELKKKVRIAVPEEEYGPDNPRRSKRTRKPRQILDI